MALRTASTYPAEAGPGAALLALLPDFPLPAAFERFLALCLVPAATGPGVGEFAALAFMWFAMSLAMMLPSAAPMIRTYCEIADTAAEKSEAVVSPLVLTAGYLAVWAAAALVFAAANLAIAAARPAVSPLVPLGGLSAAGALALAGFYQFSGLKQACLTKCRNPFAVLFARWTTRRAGVFRLGLEEGLWCLGCCWALMLVMFAVGTMNIFWMALIALFAVLEKQWESRFPSRLAGVILLVWASAVLLISL